MMNLGLKKVYFRFEAKVEGKVEVRHGLVDEASMMRLVTGHRDEDLGNSWIA